jgi:hypothetical protein
MKGTRMDAHLSLLVGLSVSRDYFQRATRAEKIGVGRSFDAGVHEISVRDE